MKRSLSFWVVVGLIFSLVVPFYVMAGNFNIVTKDGYDIGLLGNSNNPFPMKGFFVDGAGNLTIQLDVNLSDLSAAPLSVLSFGPIVNLSNFIGCRGDDGTGIITGTKGTPLSFDLLASDCDQNKNKDGNFPTVSLLYPLSAGWTRSQSNRKGTFQNTYSAAGNYLAVFSLSFTPSSPAGAQPFTSQRVVKIVISDPAAAPVISSFAADPPSIPSGQSSLLTWNLSGGTPDTLTIDNGVGSVLGSVSKWVSPTTTTTYKLTASNTAGSVSAQVNVTVTGAVNAPVISSFAANPTSIPSGQSSLLNWNLSGGTPDTLTIDNGVGSVFGSVSKWVSPTATTTYKLTASNTAGNVSAQVNVTVTPGVGACSDPTKDMSSQLASATNLNQVNPDGFYGFEPQNLYGISAGGETWFKVDPEAVLGPISGNKRLTIFILDYLQHRALTVTEYMINGTCLLNSGNLTGDNDQFTGGGILTPWPPGTKFLFKVDSTESLSLGVFWELSSF